MISLISLSIICLIVLTAFWIYKKLFTSKNEKEEPATKEVLPVVIINKEIKNTQGFRSEISITPCRMKYMLFNKHELGFHSSLLYEKVVIKNLWIDEPFHTSFFKTLLLLKNNEFFIKDKNTKVLTLFLRDEKNKTVKSTSYQVFSTKEILAYVLENTLKDINKFHTDNAKDIILAICILALYKSQHFLSFKNQGNLINEFIDIDKIQYILDLIEANDERLLFIKDTFKIAFIHSETYPYSDNIQHKKLQIHCNSPKKSLQEI